MVILNVFQTTLVADTNITKYLAKATLLAYTASKAAAKKFFCHISANINSKKALFLTEKNFLTINFSILFTEIHIFDS